MEPLNLPACDLRITETAGRRMVYDRFRDRYVRLTPEEWVRQHFAHYLVEVLAVPPGLVAIEATLTVHDQDRRADLVVYTRRGTPLLVTECKAPRVAIAQAAFDQGAQYNLALQAPYLVVTNGRQHYACRVSADGYTFLDDLPPYNELLDAC
ncbi:type I restriction enzyme HsdR N-terminal domain-containing protein [Salisaeta longa]|uniref:type I restriction enzyme HsdR N-terminal domain-containing protein n=1 Tax=Salisaeta longa TaxID=503170 RepID=UPI0003B3D542|nr:type I restriction enzyme HsdR N-terminal domain-containing protein [Salisaeta longa]